jgi:hypothetical protein
MSEAIIRGTHGEYQWLTHADLCIGEVVKACPWIFLNHFLVVASTDSGEPRWWAEKLPGWECRGFVGYSPLLLSFDGILYQTDGPDAAGWDEWYTFNEPTDVGEVIRGERNPFTEDSRANLNLILAWVNHYFLPHEDQDDELIHMFWSQIERLRPVSYISDGCERLTFVTRDPQAFDAVASLKPQVVSEK